MLAMVLCMLVTILFMMFASYPVKSTTAEVVVLRSEMHKFSAQSIGRGGYLSQGKWEECQVRAASPGPSLRRL